MADNTELMTIDDICNRVYVIRGQQVMLDYDLAEFYGYEVKALNQQVKRNIDRFPEDFMFQLKKEEVPKEFSKSQIVTLNENVTPSELRLVTAKVSEISVQVAGVVDWKNKSEDRFDNIQRSIDTLSENFVLEKDFKNFVIYKGQKIVLFTENGHGKKGFLSTAVVNDFLQQYPPIRIKPNADCHDRLIVLDYGEPTEQAYHCGASSKDAGKKLCAINIILETSMIHPVIDKLLLAPDKQI